MAFWCNKLIKYGLNQLKSSFSDLDNPASLPPPQAYQHYQEVKYINNFMDDYGVDDELNPAEEPFGATFTRLMDISCTLTAEEEQSQSAAMFETACSERIQQFDDSESDEEVCVWESGLDVGVGVYMFETHV